MPLKVAFAPTRSPNNLFDVPLVRNPDIAESKTDDAAAPQTSGARGSKSGSAEAPTREHCS